MHDEMNTLGVVAMPRTVQKFCNEKIYTHKKNLSFFERSVVWPNRLGFIVPFSLYSALFETSTIEISFEFGMNTADI